MLRGLAVNAGVVVVLLALFLVALIWTVPSRGGEITCGKASYYGTESGRRTANGEPFNGTSLTAASRTLPFGTKLRVTYRGKSVIVRVNDRGPFIKGRFLDLSKSAAARIGLIPTGVGRVCVERLR